MGDRSGYIGRAPSDSSTVISRQVYTQSGVTTTFTFSSGYQIGFLDIYVNGLRKIEGQDFTANDKSTFDILNGGVGSSDKVEAVSFKAFNLAEETSTVGIQSGGVIIGDFDTLNFVGTGNTFLQNGSTLDVSISSGGSSTLTIGVRTGAAVTFSLTGSTFNISNRSGGNVPINI